MEDQRIKKHPDYPEYAWMRLRYSKLVRQGEELWAECIGDEEATRQYIEANERFAIARKKMVAIEKKFRREMGIDHKGC